MAMPDPMMVPHHMPPVPLGKLVHDSAQNAYRDLHALMDSLPDRSSSEKKAMLLDFAQRTRHRVLRILVVVRWAMDYAGTVEKAERAVSIALQRTASYANAADSLFQVRNAASMAGSDEKLVAVAAELLSTGNFSGLPRVVGRSLGLPEPLAGDESDAKERLSEVTRSILRKCLPLAGDVRVHQWRSDKVAFATSIGVAGAWLADVGFDQLDPLRAQLHVFTVRVMIGAHTDKQSSSNGSNEANAIHMSEKQEKILVRVCNDRVRLAIHRMKAPDDAAEDDEHHQIAVDRTKKMVETIRDFMGPEVCAPLAMEHFFQQAGTISRGPLSEVFKVDALKIDKPLVVQYWRHHRRASQLLIHAQTMPHSAVGDLASSLSARTTFLTISHVPPIEESVAKNIETPQMNALDLERLLVSTMRARSIVRFAGIHKQLSEDDAFNNASVKLNLGSIVSVTIEPKGNVGGIELRIDQNKGCIRARFFGYVALMTEDTRFEFQKVGLRSLSGPFNGDEEESEAIRIVVSRALSTIGTMTSVKLFRASDIGASLVAPPGTRPIRTHTPYVPVEVSRPVSFLSIVDASKNDKTPGNAPIRVEEIGGLTFSKSDVSRVGGTASATRWLQKVRCQHNARLLRILFRSDRLLKPDAPDWVQSADKTGWYEVRGLPVDRLFVVNSEVIVTDTGTWQIHILSGRGDRLLSPVRLSTSHVIFDRVPSTRRMGAARYISYYNSTLTFSYPVISQEAVRTFIRCAVDTWTHSIPGSVTNRELDCSRTMATFAALIPKDTIFYSMIRRTPKRILFGIKGPERLTNYHSNVASSRAVRPQGGAGPPPQAANGVIAAGGNRNPTAMLRFSYRILVEFGSFPRHGFRVTVFPKTSLMAQLACRMEETMDEAHAEVGTVLAGLLERSCTIGAIAERVLIGAAGGKAIWASAVRLRAAFPETRERGVKQYQIEMDVCEGTDTVVRDIGKESELAGQQRGLSPISSWTDVVGHLSSSHSGSARLHPERPFVAMIKLAYLEEFLIKLVASVRRDAGPNREHVATSQ